MEELNSQNFDKIYDEKIVPKLEQFEKLRKKILLICCFIFFIAFVGTIAIVYCSNKNINNTLTLIIPFILATLVNILVIIRYKKNIKIQLFNSINYTYTNTTKDTNRNKSEFRKICKQFDIYNEPENNVDISNIIIGRYNLLPFSVMDTRIYYEIPYSSENDGVLKQDVFHGIVVQTKITKQLADDILIKQINLLDNKKIENKKEIQIENIEFGKIFKVYSDKQTEVKDILTPYFIENLTNYAIDTDKKAVEVYMSNKVSNEYNVFFFLHTNKENIEIPLLKPLTNKKNFYNILKEITTIIDIISM